MTRCKGVEKDFFFFQNKRMEFVSFDIETTGTLSQVDRVVEIAAVRFENGEKTEEMQSLVRIDSPMPPAATAINGITDDMLKDQPSIEEVLPLFASFCKQSVLVAHNAVFDFQFLARDILEHQTEAPQGIVLDTYNLSRKVFSRMINYKLSTLCEHLKIQTKNFHRASADAIACGKLFQHILNRLKDRSLEEVIQFSGKKPLKFPQVVRDGQLSFF